MKGDSVQVYFVCVWGGACGYTCLCERVAHVHGGQGTTPVTVSPRCHVLYFFETESFIGLGLIR